MVDSEKEFLQALKSLVKMGMVGVMPNRLDANHNMVKYEELGTLEEVLTCSENLNLPISKNMQEAINAGYKADEKIIQYCDRIIREKEQEAVETNETVIVDTIGMFSCQDDNVDCSWDIVYQAVTPNREICYERVHCY